MKKSILSVLLLLSAVCGSAETKMVIHQKSGGTIDVLLSEKPVAKYDGTDLVVTTPSSTTALSYSLADLEKITYEDITTSIKCMTIVSNDGGASRIYDLNGSLVTTVPAGQAVETSSLPQGMYIIKNNSHSYKIQKK